MCRMLSRRSGITQHTTFFGERIDGYEEPCALITKEAARALKAVRNELFVQGYRLKVFDAYRPACAVRAFVLWGLENQDKRMKAYFCPSMDKDEPYLDTYFEFSVSLDYLRR